MMRSKGNYLLGNDVAMYFWFLWHVHVAVGQWYLVLRAYKFVCGRFFSLLDTHTNITTLISVLQKLCLSTIKSRFSGKLSVSGGTNLTFPKRRDFQLHEGELKGSLLLLTLGDAAKIRFGSRWHNVEVAESWSPKPRKGMYH